MTLSPTTIPVTPLAAAIEPAFLDMVLHHEELSLGAKTIVVYLLASPQGRSDHAS